MSAQQPIPVFESLAEIYPSNVAVLRESQRWNALLDKFTQAYGSRPSHIIRAPGRVNILGEHIDYSLFPVLPAAIEQDILIALRPTTTPRVRLSNVSPSFTSADFIQAPPQDDTGEWHVDFVSPKNGGKWDNYVKVALVEGLGEYFKGGKSRLGVEPKGMELMVSGTVPPGAGLSSSAAFVVASVIAFLTANDLSENVTKGDIVAMAMASEHRMGLNSGGMDQAASALCLSNSILHLSFYPHLDTQSVPLPSNFAIVITNSLAAHELTASAPRHYNLRVVEMQCATRLLIHAWGLSDHPRVKDKMGKEGRLWLREALEMWNSGSDEDRLYHRAIEESYRILGSKGRDRKGWTREEMIAESGMSESAFTHTYLDFLEVEADHFHLHTRVLHSLKESLRVLRFASICQNLSPSGPVPEDDTRLVELGALLNASHDSCQYAYDCTAMETDLLRDLCLANGAIGSRQTGGGWGGAVVSLVPVGKAQEFLDSIKMKYPLYRGLGEDALNEAAFATLPGSGAGVYLVQGEVEA